MGVAHLVKEALEDQQLAGRQCAQCRTRRGQIVTQLLHRQFRDRQFPQTRLQCLDSLGENRIGVFRVTQQSVGLSIEPRYRMAQLVGAARRLAKPERHGRRLTVSVLDDHLAGFHLAYPKGCVAQLEDIAGQAFKGEILAQGPDAMTFRCEDHFVVELIRNHPGIGDRRQTRILARPQAAVDRIQMHIGAAPAALGVVALGQHLDHLIEAFTGKLGVGLGLAAHRVERIQRPLARTHLADNLLCQHIQRRLRGDDGIQLAALGGIQQCSALQQIVLRQREQPPLGGGADGMTGTADPLQESRDGTR